MSRTLALACTAALLAVPATGGRPEPPANLDAELARATRLAAAPRQQLVDEPSLFLGVELQAYPAGVIGGVHLQRAFSPRDTLTFRMGWNETDRQDFGEHDDESGGGFGGGIGYRRWLGDGRRGWLWGARVDLWSLEIDWKNDPPTAASGSTDVLVLQPALEGGYSWRMGKSRWRWDVTASVGMEINVDTDGEDVGEGAIGLLGATLVYGL